MRILLFHMWTNKWKKSCEGGQAVQDCKGCPDSEPTDSKFIINDVVWKPSAMSFRRLTKGGFNVRLLLGSEAETDVVGRQQSILKPVIEICTDFRNCYMHDSSVYDRSMR